MDIFFEDAISLCTKRKSEMTYFKAQAGNPSETSVVGVRLNE